MEFYLAPMEGITGYVYRNAHKQFYGTVHKYFTPYIAPNKNRCMNGREYRDVLLEHNEGIRLVPQILTNQADLFLKTCEELQNMGYEEINLNLGCPSGTVVSKGKGAGFLAEPAQLDRFLDTVFRNVTAGISIKTRIGMEDAKEFEQLLHIYNQYPLKELIVHPRLQKDFYKNTPDWESFALAVEKSRFDVCYNGDIFTRRHYQQFVQRFPSVQKLMVGRGCLVNPALLHLLQDQPAPGKEVLRRFHDQLLEEYAKILKDERSILFKMKELWFYLCHSFSDYEKPYKKIKKAQRLVLYQSAVSELFQRDCV